MPKTIQKFIGIWQTWARRVIGKQFCLRRLNKVLTCFARRCELEALGFLLDGALIAYFLGRRAASLAGSQKLNAGFGVHVRVQSEAVHERLRKGSVHRSVSVHRCQQNRQHENKENTYRGHHIAALCLPAG